MTTAVGVAARARSLWLLAALTATVLAGLCALAIAFCLAMLNSILGVLGLIGTALSGVALAGLAVGLGAVAGRLLALPPWRALWAGATVVATGSLLWLLPAVLRMPTAATGLPLAAVWAANLAVPLLPATALLPARRARLVAAVLATALLVAWLPLRQLVVTSAANHALRGLGNPSRALLRQVDWPAMTADAFHYADGRVTLEYLSAGPTPDATDGVLTIATGTSPCDLPLPQGLGIQPADCHPVGPNLWSRADCALVLQTGDVLVELAESGPGCTPEEQTALQAVLRSQRPVTDLQLLDLTG